jgi:hypothetical protein
MTMKKAAGFHVLVNDSSIVHEYIKPLKPLQSSIMHALYGSGVCDVRLNRQQAICMFVGELALGHPENFRFQIADGNAGTCGQECFCDRFTQASSGAGY